MDTDNIIDSAILLLRVTLGMIFLVHGLQRLLGIFDTGGIEELYGMLKDLGFAYPLFWAWTFPIAKALGGLLLIFGMFPRLNAAINASIITATIVKVSGPKGFFIAQGGCEYQLLLLIVCIFLMLTGGGKFSIFDKF